MAKPINYASKSPDQISLSQLADQIQAVIDGAFQQTYWVVGDVKSHNFHQRKWHFFDLCETEEGTDKLKVKIPCNAWREGTERITHFENTTGQRFTNDLHVLIKVKVEYHPVYGIKLTLLDISATFTLGQIEQLRQATIARLLTQCADYITQRGDTFITRNAQLPLPRVIQHIAIISSSTAAGYQDFRNILDHSETGYRFHLDPYFTEMQGQANAQKIVDQLVKIYHSGRNYDAIIITRGGGSQTDLLLFDQFIVCRAIAKFPIPIITGIGHQRDQPLAELMANVQASTPTKAAEFLINHNRTFEDELLRHQKHLLLKAQTTLAHHSHQLSQAHSTLTTAIHHHLSNHKDHLYRHREVIINRSKTLLFNQKDTLTSFTHTLLTIPQTRLSNEQTKLTNTLSNLQSFTRSYLKHTRGYLNHHVTMIKVMDPTKLLARGFALLYQNGKIITDPSKLNQRQDLDIKTDKGDIQAKIKSIKPKN